MRGKTSSKSARPTTHVAGDFGPLKAKGRADSLCRQRGLLENALRQPKSNRTVLYLDAKRTVL
jgi:hypothetical protein